MDGDGRRRIDRIEIASHGDSGHDIDFPLAGQHKAHAQFAVAIAYLEPHGIGLAQLSHDPKHFGAAAGHDHDVAGFQLHVGVIEDLARRAPQGNAEDLLRIFRVVIVFVVLVRSYRDPFELPDAAMDFHDVARQFGESIGRSERVADIVLIFGQRLDARLLHFAQHHDVHRALFRDGNDDPRVLQETVRVGAGDRLLGIQKIHIFNVDGPDERQVDRPVGHHPRLERRRLDVGNHARNVDLQDVVDAQKIVGRSGHDQVREIQFVADDPRWHAKRVRQLGRRNGVVVQRRETTARRGRHQQGERGQPQAWANGFQHGRHQRTKVRRGPGSKRQPARLFRGLFPPIHSCRLPAF